MHPPYLGGAGGGRNPDVVIGKASEHTLLPMFEKDRTHSAYILIIKRARMRMRDFKYLLTAGMLLLWSYPMRDIKGLGARTLAVAEYMILAHRHTVHEMQGFLE